MPPSSVAGPHGFSEMASDTSWNHTVPRYSTPEGTYKTGSKGRSVPPPQATYGRRQIVIKGSKSRNNLPQHELSGMISTNNQMRLTDLPAAAASSVYELAACAMGYSHGASQGAPQLVKMQISL